MMGSYMEASGSAYWVCGSCGAAVATDAVHHCPKLPYGTYSSAAENAPVTPAEIRHFMAEVLRILRQIEENQRRTWR